MDFLGVHCQPNVKAHVRRSYPNARPEVTHMSIQNYGDQFASGYDPRFYSRSYLDIPERDKSVPELTAFLVRGRLLVYEAEEQDRDFVLGSMIRHTCDVPDSPVLEFKHGTLRGAFDIAMVLAPALTDGSSLRYIELVYMGLPFLRAVRSTGKSEHPQADAHSRS